MTTFMKGSIWRFWHLHFVPQRPRSEIYPVELLDGGETRFVSS